MLLFDFSLPCLYIYICIYIYELWHFLEAQLPGTTQDHLQIFNIELKAKIKSHQMPEQVRSQILI